MKTSMSMPQMIMLCLAFCLAIPVSVLGQWGYTIGQKEVPRPVIHDSSSFKVYPGRPRLFFRDTDLPAIRKRINGEFSGEWKEMLSDLEKNVLPNPPSGFGEGSYLKNWTSGRNVAFVALITGEGKYIKWAKGWMKALVSSGPIGNDDQYRGRLQSMAVAYDWLCPWLTELEKQQLRENILEHIDTNWHFAARADYVGGHSRWGNFALQIGLLSIITDRPDLWEKLMIVRNHWVNGYHLVQGWIAADGGYHMGWSYSHAYLKPNNHCVWSSATNDCTFYPWQGLLSHFWLYGQQGDGEYPNTGDAYFVGGIDYNSESDIISLAAGVFKNPYASLMIRKRPDRFMDILYGDKSVPKIAPDDKESPLPLSRHFRNTGVIIARDRWDKETTQLQFRSVSFYSANHHHRDENTFTLHYRGPLALDAGYYDSYGSNHWDNYFTRTIAHNGIVVYSTDQEMKVYGRPASNDGGQTYRKEPQLFEDILPGGHAHLDGIIDYKDTDDYTYAVGDATKAYDSERVKLAQRKIVYLRNVSAPHPVVVVFDRVESTQSQLVKKFLLHTVNKPVVRGKMAIADNEEGGRISCVTLLPEEATLQLVGGPGKEFWVDGKNYPIDSKSLVPESKEPGAWRLEVSPKKKQTMDYFLHVLFVDDSGVAQVKTSAAKLLKDGQTAGVSVAGWKIIFSFAQGKKAIVEKNTTNRK